MNSNKNMKKYMKILSLFISILFLSGCASRSAADVIFPIRFVSPQQVGVGEEAIRVEWKNHTTYHVSPWEVLDKSADIDVADVVVRARSNLGKITLQISNPTARLDFNDSYVQVDPKLLHIMVNNRIPEGIIIENGRLSFNYDIYNTTATSSFILDIDYNNQFRTRRNITVVWLSEVDL